MEKSSLISPMALKLIIEETAQQHQKGNPLVGGQSGIVVHIYDNDRRLLALQNVKVVSSNEKKVL